MERRGNRRQTMKEDLQEGGETQRKFGGSSAPKASKRLTQTRSPMEGNSVSTRVRHLERDLLVYVRLREVPKNR